jgi:hypothetical protein
MIVKTKKRALKTKKNMKGGWSISKIFRGKSSSKYYGVKALSREDKARLYSQIQLKKKSNPNINSKKEYKKMKIEEYIRLKTQKNENKNSKKSKSASVKAENAIHSTSKYGRIGETLIGATKLVFIR